MIYFLIKIKIVLFLITFVTIQDVLAQISIPENSQQMLLVISENWDSPKGKLIYLERKSSKESWQVIDSIFAQPIDVQLGKNGLAWGQGLHQIPNSEKNIKKEGDGKAPAGIFELTQIFGYHQPNFELKMPFLLATSNLLCVDDMNSNSYNQLINTTKIESQGKDWDSYENMLRQDNLYEWGVVISHNMPVIGKANGSCIFLHIQKGEDIPTAGCTSMKKGHLLKIIQKLDENKLPILVQLPKEASDKIEEQLAGLVLDILE